MTRLLAAIAAVALLLTGVVKGGSAEAAEADPMVGAPTVGECHDITMKQGYRRTLTEEPVACSQDHTLVVSGVVEVPADIDMSDSDAVMESTDCSPFIAKLVGSAPLLRARTLYYSFAFMATAAQQREGARWVSCHVAVWDTKGLNDLPAKLPRATKRPADSVAACVTARFQAVTCAERHAYRSDTTFFLRAKGTDKAVERAMKTQAPRACDRRLRGRFAYRWWRYSSSKALVVCARATTR